MDLTPDESHPIITPEPAVETLNKSTESRDSKASPSTSATTPVKNRRKRKPNVTKKVSAADASLSENDMEMMNNSGIDVETNILTSAITSEPMRVNHESDDCETIDKIAQMVSNITSTTSVAPQQPTKENDEMIEHQLEKMFAESQEAAAAAAVLPALPELALEVNSAPTSDGEIQKENGKKKTQTKPKQPRKRKNDGAVGKKKQVAGAAKLKNGKPAKRRKKIADGAELNSKLEVKPKVKENGKSKAKADVAPFVAIQKDGTFAIVNQTANGDDDTEKSVSKPKKLPNNDKNRAIRGLHGSTLSKKYDADKRDTTWVCVFCKLGPHKHKLGDLFGPYIISKKSEEYSHCLQDPTTDIFRQSNKNKFAKVQLSSPTSEKPKKKRKLNTSTSSNGAVSGDEIFTGMAKVDDHNFEVWFHEECITWSAGVYIIGTKIVGMEAAIWASTRYRCAYCGKNGAMLSCLTRECHKPSHFGCAKKSWKLDEDFKTFCELHHELLITK